ncbi:hypothetical protein PV08_04700 [Exophiala spinifera]|uniref:Enoyl reductase (ER) domain-containing protein n=1 Tax=Exophiala spinifera TaxID=91928 RepID=A0A0D1YQM4_9EURO|nr:uncharacterized protein PV08_04700 [Exophiala spinifera]KIW17506.1 hypothetical protein PV08_04700 [Exophiala spinifera]
MARTNRAAWLPGPHENLEIRPSELVKPGRDQVLVKNRAVSINPIDWKIQDGYMPTDKPRILGQDVAGEVVEVGTGVTGFSVGQRVLAHVVGLATGIPQQSAFQGYSVATVLGTCPIPDDVSFEQAAVLPLAVSTAAHGLFSPKHLGLPLPRPHDVAQQEDTGTTKRTGTLLVWGAASSVGCVAVQLAVAAGVKVVATASKRNFDFCKHIGAEHVFDYNSPSVVGDLTDALEEKNVIGAYDALVLAQLGGGPLAVTLSPADEIPATVNANPGMSVTGFFSFTITTDLIFFPPSFFFFYAVNIIVSDKDKAIGHAIWHEFLPDALKSGQIKPLPNPFVFGHGLESLQGALDKQRAGVSAAKVVVTL